jgi:predicted small lipoprotein YifL
MRWGIISWLFDAGCTAAIGRFARCTMLNSLYAASRVAHALVVVVLLASVLLSGCGLKGPLYLPTPQQEREMAERKKRLEEREQREKQQQEGQTSQPQQQPEQPQQ